MNPFLIMIENLLWWSLSFIKWFILYLATFLRHFHGNYKDSIDLPFFFFIFFCLGNYFQLLLYVHIWVCIFIVNKLMPKQKKKTSKLCYDVKNSLECYVTSSFRLIIIIMISITLNSFIKFLVLDLSIILPETLVELLPILLWCVLLLYWHK